MDPKLKEAFQLALSLCDDLNEICEPVKHHFHVNFFRYTKSFKNRKKITLSTSEAWLKAYFENAYYLIELADYQKHPAVSKGINMHGECKDDHPTCNFWKSQREHLNFQNVFCMYYKEHDQLELFDFAISQDVHRASNTFLNNIELFKHFITYFRWKAHPLIECAQEKSFSTPKIEHYDFSENWLLGLPKLSKEEFWASIKAEHIYLVGKFDGIYLTRTEALSLKLVLEGKKYREIGEMLNYSPRTIEDFIASVKCKLKVRTKSELLETCFAHRIDHQLGILGSAP